MAKESLDWDRLDPAEIPDKFVLSHPLVSELAESANLNKFQFPLILPNQILMDEGKWNNRFYSAESIQRALDQTNWSDREKSDLFLDHKDKDADKWAGTVTNKHMEGKQLLGDLVIHDWLLARKMSSGKPKFGVSPRVKGKVDLKTMEMFDFVFDNFSIVINPAIKTAYINNSEEIADENESIRLYKTVAVDLAVAATKPKLKSEKLKMEVSDKMAEEEEAKPAEEEKPEEAKPEEKTEAEEAPEAPEAAETTEEETPTEEAEEEKPAEKPAGEDLSEKITKNKLLIGGLESLLSELKVKQEAYKPKVNTELHNEIKDLTSTVQKMQATIVKLGSKPDRRSVKADLSGSAEYTAKLKEIQKDPDEAMRKWIQNTTGGRS